MKIATEKWVIENSSKINIIDVRSKEEFQSGHINNSKNIPLAGILLNSDSLLNKETEYYLICKTGFRSMQAYNHLSKKGYKVVQVDMNKK